MRRRMGKNAICFVLLCSALFLACHPRDSTGASPAASSSQTISSEKEQVTPTPAFISSLPPQFFLSGKFAWDTGERVTLQAVSKLSGRMQIFVYRVKTPLLFLDGLGDLENPHISPATLAALGRLLEDEGIDNPLRKDYSEELPVEEFSLYKRQYASFSANSAHWQKASLDIGDLSQGLYLVEGRLGPQASYMPLLVSSISLISRYDQGHIFNMVSSREGPQGDFPIFYRKHDKWQSLRTNREGIARIEAPISWIVARRGDVLQIQRGMAVNDGHLALDRLWLDRQHYRAGETLHIAWIMSEPVAKASIRNNNGQLLFEHEFSSPVALGDYSLPLPDTAPEGRYQLEIGKRQKAFFVTSALPISAPQERMVVKKERSEGERPTTEQNVFRCGQLIVVEVTSLSRREIEMSIFHVAANGEKSLYDRQTRFTKDFQAYFFFTPQHPGEYQLQTIHEQKTIFAYSENEPIAEGRIEREVFDFPEQTVACIVPTSPVAQLATFEQLGVPLQYQIIPANSPTKRVFFWDKARTEGQLHLFRRQKPRSQHHCWQIRFADSIHLDVQMPEKIRAGQRIALKIASESGKQCMVWAVAGDNRPRVLLCSPTIERTVRAAAVTIPSLHRAWIREQVTRLYSVALVCYRQRRYTTTIKSCREILRLMPNHAQAKRLFLQTMQLQEVLPGSFHDEEEALQLRKLLQKTIIDRTFTRIHLEDFCAVLSEESGVYIEIDPRIGKKYSIEQLLLEKLPTSENALSLLEYVLETRNLALKEEYGTLLITLPALDSTDSLLEKLDDSVNRQLPLLQISSSEQDAKTIGKTAFWRSWQPCRPVADFTVEFPEPGLWTIHVVATEGRNYYEEARVVWVR